MINSSDSSINTHGETYGELEGDGHHSNEGEGHSNKDTAIPLASSDNDSASPWAATGDSSIPPPSSPPSMIPSAPKCKPSAFLVPTNSSSISGSIDSGKQPCITGPVAMLGIKDKLANLNSTLRMATESKVKVAKHQLAKLSDSDVLDQAQDMLHDKEVGQISNEALMMIDLFESDIRKGKTYMRFKDDGLRRMWLKRELQKMNYQEQDVAMD
jgi:hypothetical protein